jgi:hypothetical protein
LDGLEAEVQACFTMADEVDAGNGSPELLREYRFWLRMIREALADHDGVDENVTSLFARLGGTPVRNVADGG